MIARHDGAAMKLSDWLERYGRAWEAADEESVVTLFTEDARYRPSPFREPFVGHDEIRAYWRHATGGQRGAHVRMGRPSVDGDRVAVEWWTTMTEGGQEVTFPGCLLLRRGPDGRCTELREYWHLAPGRREPFVGWAG